MKPNSPGERLYNGIIKENPTFVQLLGMCPTLAVTTSAINGLGMGLTTTIILAMSNVVISMLRKIIPDGVRMPAYIVVVASLVTIVQFLLQGYVPSLYESLGIFIPLIVVNCIILGRAEAFASKNKIVPSIIDAIGQSLGYGLALFIMAFIREFLGTQSITLSNPFDSTQSVTLDLLTDFKISFFTSSAGAFITMAIILAVIAAIKQSKENKAKKGDAK